MRKAILILPFLLIIAVAGFAYFKFHNPTCKTGELKPEYRISAVKLFNEYQLVETTANSKYMNRVIEVSGKVKEVKSDLDGAVWVVIDAGNALFAVSCKLAQSEIPFANQIQKQEQVTLRGTCKGIMIDVILDECMIN